MWAGEAGRRGALKSVQVLFNGIEAVMVLTFRIGCFYELGALFGSPYHQDHSVLGPILTWRALQYRLYSNLQKARSC